MKIKGRHIWNSFLDMLFPAKCIFSRKEGAYISEPYKVKLQHKIQPKEIEIEDFGFCVSAFSYHDDLVKTVVEYFKFHGFGSLGVGKL